MLRARTLLLLLALSLAAFAGEPTRYVSPHTGLSVTLPEGWTGTPAVNERGLPGTATYVFTNANPESPLAGAVLRIERRTGLNAVLRQRWMQGRVDAGYHGARPVAAVPTPFGAGLGLRCARADGRHTVPSLVYFTMSASAYYAIQVEAPPAVFAAHETTLAALAAAVTFGDGRTTR